MKSNNLKLCCLSGIFTALVYVVTAYLHIPTYNGYIHIGDGLIYLAACILPTPYAVFVGAMGAMLADILCGFALWAPGSVVIKAAAAIFFTSKSKKIITKRSLMAILPASVICIVGYYLYEVLIYGSSIAALYGMIGSAIQSAASAILFVVLGLAMDKLNVKSRLSL